MKDQWKKKIRHAHEPDNPALLSLWLTFEEGESANLPDDKQWQQYINIVRLLLDTYSDTLNPDHWRSTCLDQISRPLCSLHKLAKNHQQQEQLKSLLLEIKILSHYFCPSFIR